MLLSEQLIQFGFEHEHTDDYYGTSADIYRKFWDGGGIIIINPDLWYRDVFLLKGTIEDCDIVVKLEHPRIGRVISLAEFIKKTTNIQTIREEISRGLKMTFCEYPIAQPLDHNLARR